MTQSKTELDYVPFEDQEQSKEVVKQVRFQVGDDEIFVDKDIVEQKISEGKVNFIPFMGEIAFLTNEEYDDLLETIKDLKNGIR